MARSVTLLQRFYDQVHRYGSTRVALRANVAGQWTSWSWRDYAQEVGRVATALKTAGFEEGDTVAILAANCPQWLFVDLAAMALGGVSTGIYPSETPDQVEYITQHCDAKFLFVDSEEQLAKTQFRNKTGTTVILLQPGIESSDDDVLDWFSFIAAGESLYDQDPSQVEEQARSIKPDRNCMLVYTSGTTGMPKGAMYNHANLLFESDALRPLLGGDEQECISFLPLCHVAERLQAEIVAINAGNMITFARSLETLKDDLVFTQPTVLLCVPRLWEKFYTALNEQFAQARGIKRKLLQRTISVGSQIAESRHKGLAPSRGLLWQWAFLESRVVSKIRAALGLQRCLTLVSGAAPLDAQITDFFAALGMDIIEVYGQTESMGVITANRHGAIRSGSVGLPLTGVDVKIADDGELLTKGPHVFQGYFKDADATAETIIDGWLYTGDIAHFDEEGFVRITDRKKDILVTAGGKNVAPQQVESGLKMLPGISQAVVVGDKRKYLTALLTLDATTLPTLATQVNIDLQQYETVAATDDSMAEYDMHKLILNSDLQDYFKSKIEDINADQARYASIKAFRILPTDFSVENGELTPTQKVKRRVVQQHYAELIDQMYT